MFDSLFKLLQRLNDLCERGNAAAQGAEDIDMEALGGDEAVTFVNFGLAAKVEWLLEDAFAVSTGSVAEWPRRLASLLPGLLPLHLRQRLMRSTMLGVPRALQGMHNGYVV